MSSQRPSGGIVTQKRADNKTCGVAKTGGDATLRGALRSTHITERQSDRKTLPSGLNNPRQATGGGRGETSGFSGGFPTWCRSRPGDTGGIILRVYRTYPMSSAMIGLTHDNVRYTRRDS